VKVAESVAAAGGRRDPDEKSPMNLKAFALALLITSGGGEKTAPTPARQPARFGAYRVLEVGENGVVREVGRPPAYAPVVSTGAPMPVGWLTQQVVINQGETVLVRAANGRKIRSLSVNTEGVVEARAVDPYSVRLTGVRVGVIKLSVETK
jgi:hypothetical protein